MNRFEDALTAWAKYQIRQGPDPAWSKMRDTPDSATIEITEVLIEADPGNDRDDSYAEGPSTSIVIHARVDGRPATVKVHPDLLTIVRELGAITRDLEAKGRT